MRIHPCGGLDSGSNPAPGVILFFGMSAASNACTVLLNIYHWCTILVIMDLKKILYIPLSL